MIFSLWHPGSGIGDQAFAYLATRVRAEDLGVPFGMIGEFKGASFMQIDRGEPVNLKYHIEQPSGAIVIDEPHKLIRLDTPYFNPEFFFIEDGTVIDGYGAQSIQYFEHRLDEIREWLKVKTEIIPMNICMLNIRGGEYRGVPNLILPLKDYWYKAMGIMKRDHKVSEFIIQTDDAEYCRLLFGDTFRILSDIQVNWSALRWATKAIISNSAFAIIPRLLAHSEDPNAITIAPRGWANRNNFDGNWQRPNNYYKKFLYI